MEAFGTSVSLHVTPGSSWLAYEPVDYPDLVIITPPCGPWSSLQAINDPAVVAWKRLTMAYHLWAFTRKVWDSRVTSSRG